MVTTEISRGWRLEEVRISSSGRGNESFDRNVLRDDLRQATLNTLSEPEIREITNAVTAELQDHLAERVRTTSAAAVIEARDATVERPQQFLTGTQIAETTEKALRQSNHRLAHVLYALSVRGRGDQRHSTGWKTAEDVLNWIGSQEEYAPLKKLFPTRPVVPKEIWAPVRPNSVPSMVVKKGARGRAPFDMTLFSQSVEKAMHGRPDPQWRGTCVAQLVVRNLEGQSVIHSAQLAVGVLDALRRVDDIAYLRWATLFKQITLVSELYEEALGLISDPSPTLRFEDPAHAVQTRLATDDISDRRLFE